MFAIFSLRRPDILPVGRLSTPLALGFGASFPLISLACSGDLGVQRGLARWFLSLHSPAHTYTLSPEKVDASTSFQRRKTNHASNDVEDDALPTVASSANKLEGGEAAAIGGVNRDGDTMTSDTSASTLLPPPFTPSIQKTLSKAPEKAVPLPTGITISLLKSRLDGKKVK
ncbi:hypothetical protein CC2G_008802 [Coprinopsis cinerea AmutBmut pab1-1]|jgi:DNA-3-methyladenine glycosylase II|nr:hypothetical protein CC2G_008802 [Coprinopsis cinerea AmutBmut pab1-1]